MLHDIEIPVSQCNVEVVPNGSGPCIKPTAVCRPTLLWQVLAVEMWWTTSFSMEQTCTPAMMVASSRSTTPARLVTLTSSTCSCNTGPMPTPETTGITPRCTRLPSRARSTSASVKFTGCFQLVLIEKVLWTWISFACWMYNAAISIRFVICSFAATWCWANDPKHWWKDSAWPGWTLHQSCTDRWVSSQTSDLGSGSSSYPELVCSPIEDKEREDCCEMTEGQ